MTRLAAPVRRFLSGLLTACLVICAVLITGALVKREFFPARESSLSAVREIEGWQHLARGGHRMGVSHPAVSIVEFSDFQCPFCAEAQQALEEVRLQYPHQVAVVYRHFPLEEIHPHARKAALASECAAAQGRFESFHDALFTHQDSIGQVPWEDFARRADIRSVETFTECLASKHLESLVEQDASAARSLGLMGTPAIIVNGRLLMGAPSAADLELEVRRALASH
jgi:protein-disulfide isomerase